MDTKTLISEAKARFNHNSAKAYLKEKYESKLLLAEQGGLWRADPTTLAFLNSITDETVVLIDTFNNPIKVNRLELFEKLTELYKEVMEEYYEEWSELEKKR